MLFSVIKIKIKLQYKFKQYSTKYKLIMKLKSVTSYAVLCIIHQPFILVKRKVDP